MKHCVILSVVSFILLGCSLSAQTVPIDLQTKFILKIASEDKNFARYGNPIKVGVTSDEALNAFKAMEDKLQIKGVNYVTEKISSIDAVSNYKIVHIGPEWSANYSAVAAICKTNKIPMFCTEDAPVMSNGASVGFKVLDGKPKIVVNLANANDQGCDFNAGFLKITVVVGGLDN